MAYIRNVMEDLMKPQEQGGIGMAAVKNLYEFSGRQIKYFEWIQPLDALEKIMRPVISADLFVQSFTVILGKAGTGKSYAGAILLEQIINIHVPVFLVDFTGEQRGVVDYFAARGKKIRTIEELKSGETEYKKGKKVKMIPTTYGASDAEQFLSGWDSFYLDVSEYVDQPGLVKQYLVDFLTQAIIIKKQIFRDTEHSERKRPHYMYFDEAHNFAPEELPAEERNLDPPFPAILNERMATVAKEMRKYGLPCCWLSQRARSCNKNVLAEVNVKILLPVDLENDVGRYRALLPSLPKNMLVSTMNDMAKYPGRCFLKVDGKVGMFPAPLYYAQIAKIRKSEDRAQTPGMAENDGFRYGKGTEKGKNNVVEEEGGFGN